MRIVLRFGLPATAALLLALLQVRAQERSEELRAWTERLNSPNPLARSLAVQSIGRLGQHAAVAVPDLIRVLEDPDVRVRAAAASALGQLRLQPDRVLPALAKMLRDDGRSSGDQPGQVAVSEAAGSALGLYGRDALPLLLRATQSDSPLVKRAAAVGIAQLGPEADQAAVARLVSIAQRADTTTRRYALYALESIGPAADAAVAPLVSLLDSQDADLQAAAARALGAIGPAARPAEDRLQQLLASRQTQVRSDAATALGRLGHDVQPQTITLLVETLHDQRPRVRVNAAVALSRLGRQPDVVIPALIGAMDSEVHVAMTPLWKTLGMAVAEFEAPAIPFSSQALSDASDATCRGVAVAAARLGPDAAPLVPELTRCLDREDDRTRQSVILALEKIGPAAVSAVPALKYLVDHEDFHTQYLAARALGSIGSAAHVANLRLLRFLRTGMPLVRLHCAAALGEIGPHNDQQATLIVAGLIGALNDPAQPVRENALASLGKLGDVARPAIPMIKFMLRSNRSFAPRAEAARTLLLLDPDSKLPAEVLLSELQRTDRPWEAARILGQVGPQLGLVQQVTDLLQADSHLTREYAAEALGGMGPTAHSALGPLRKVAAEDPLQEVRSSAQLAIDRITAAASGD